MPWIIIAVIILLLAVVFATQYNALIKLRNKAEAAFAQIDVQLKRRADLIPNVIETVKGYAAHESSVLQAVTDARDNYFRASTVEEKIGASNDVSGALSRLFALGEAYPDLKANQNYLDLQKTLKDTEDKIAYARQFYNDDVTQYKNRIEMFPSNIVANLSGFRAMPLYEIRDAERENIRVSF